MKQEVSQTVILPLINKWVFSGLANQVPCNYRKTVMLGIPILQHFGRSAQAPIFLLNAGNLIGAKTNPSFEVNLRIHYYQQKCTIMQGPEMNDWSMELSRSDLGFNYFKTKRRTSLLSSMAWAVALYSYGYVNSGTKIMTPHRYHSAMASLQWLGAELTL